MSGFTLGSVQSQLACGGSTFRTPLPAFLNLKIPEIVSVPVTLPKSKKFVSNWIFGTPCDAVRGAERFVLESAPWTEWPQKATKREHNQGQKNDLAER